MNRYARVDAPRASVRVDGAEVRVTTGGKMRDYVSYAAERLEADERVVLTGCGRAIPKAVAVAEILKRRISGAHQVTDVSSLTNDDRFEAIESGLDDVHVTRRVSVVRVALCRDAREMDANAPGYQPPIEAGRVSPLRTGAALESRARRLRRAQAATRKPPRDDATMEDVDADEARVGDGTTPNGKRRVRRGGGGRRRAEEGGARNREEPIDA